MTGTNGCPGRGAGWLGPLALLLVLTGGPAPARAKPSGLNMPQVQTWTLDNGLQVAHLAVTKAPVVTVQVWYHAGSKDEDPARRGSAHMFEHMLFKGTERVRPEEHARHIQRLGGSINAFTHQDATAYHNTLPKEYLEFACELESERMRNLLLRQEMIDTEREVVKEELRLRIEQNPVTLGLRRFFQEAFTVHPYQWLPGGEQADLDAITLAELKGFYDAYYQPNNAMLVVVGDVTMDEARACAARFAAIPPGPEPPRPAAAKVEPVQKSSRREVVDPAAVGIVLNGYHVPEAKHADSAALEALALILGGGESSRLHRRLVRQDKVAVAAAGQQFSLEHPGLFLVFGVYLNSDQGAAVERALADEVAKVQKQPPTARELQKAKNQLLAGFVFGLENVAGLAQQIGFSWIYAGDPSWFVGALARYQALRTSDIQRVAKAYLNPNNQTTVVVPPQGGAK
jgi:zinc protease